MIVVFGDINIDMVIQVENLPRPGETINGSDYVLLPGGKGANQAVAAALAGTAVSMFGQVGEDPFSSLALAHLKKSGVDLSGIQNSSRPTGCAAVWVESGGENSIVVAGGANHEVNADQVPNDLLTADTSLILQMHVPLEENWRLARRAKSKGARIYINVAPAGPVPYDILELVDLLIVNELEGEAIASQVGIEIQDHKDLPQKFSARFGNTCVLTLGAEGAIAFGVNGGLTVSALPITPIDTVGAGDAFVGILVATLHEGADLRRALHYASVGAGLCCTKIGAQTSLPSAAAIEAQVNLIEQPSTIN